MSNNTRNVKALRAEKSKEQDGCCFYCERQFTHENYATLDELIPQSKGGKRLKENTVAACYDCNAKRGVMDWKMFKRLVIAKRKLRARRYKIRLEAEAMP